jgi:Ca-activated chloride channel family protein
MIELSQLTSINLLITTLFVVISILLLFKSNYKKSSKIIRFFILLAFIFLSFNPKLIVKEPKTNILLVDESISFKNYDKSSLINTAKNLSKSLQIIPFANGVNLNSYSSLDTKNTNLESSLKYALNKANGGDIILITDGNENLSSVRKIPAIDFTSKIFPIFPNQNHLDLKECKIIEFEAPLSVANFESIDVRTTISNDTSLNCTGKLLIFQQDELINETEVTIESSSQKVFANKSKPIFDGQKKFSAKFISNNSQENSSITKYVTSAKRQKILLINGTTLDARILSNLLRQQSFQIEEKFGDQSSISLDTNSSYSSIILNNFSLKNQPEYLAKSLEQYVYSGGKLITIGGERAYGLGGYRDSDLEKALPVFSLPPETEQKRLNAAVQLVLDKSKSMEQQNRLDFVKAASKEVIKSLKDDDYLGLIAFDNEPFIRIPINRLSQIRLEALSLVDKFFPSGSTRMLKALQMAGMSLERVPAGRKHIIVLTDGRLPDAGPMYLELVKQLRISGVTVSTVLISQEDGNYPLKEMAEIGGGVFYVTNDPSTLPKIFLQDIRVSTGERTVKESQDLDIKRGPSGILSTKVQQFPRLKGFVSTKVKDGANSELLIANGQGGFEPLLSSWNYGKGKATAFSSDLYGRWSDRWTSWDNLPQFINDLINFGNINSESGLDYSLTSKLNGGVLTLDLTLYSGYKSESITANVNGELVNFSNKSKGLFTADYFLDGKKEKLDIEIKVGENTLPVFSYSVPDYILDESKNTKVNVPLLSYLASVSGGELNPKELPATSTEKTKKISLRDYIIWLILILVLLEIISRETNYFKRLISKIYKF